MARGPQCKGQQRRWGACLPAKFNHYPISPRSATPPSAPDDAAPRQFSCSPVHQFTTHQRPRTTTHHPSGIIHHIPPTILKPTTSNHRRHGQRRTPNPEIPPRPAFDDRRKLIPAVTCLPRGVEKQPVANLDGPDYRDVVSTTAGAAVEPEPV
ncbi:hypothetical protein RJ55_05569 [Drechmeria coniospora]|nr:hypothetical protein RJ55_05569 [Drechmeria coniospora]